MRLSGGGIGYSRTPTQPPYAPVVYAPVAPQNVVVYSSANAQVIQEPLTDVQETEVVVVDDWEAEETELAASKATSEHVIVERPVYVPRTLPPPRVYAAPPPPMGLYQPYPYAYDTGLLHGEDTQERSTSWLLELQALGGYANDTGVGQFDARLLTPSRWEVAGGGSTTFQQEDVNTLAHLGPAFRFYQGARVFARVEAGARAGFDGRDAVPGWYVGGGLTWHLFDPLILDVSANTGGLGGAQATEASAFLGVVLGRVALRGGYRVLFMDDVGTGAPMIGLGFWL